MLLGRTEYVLFYSIVIERNEHRKTICTHKDKRKCSEAKRLSNKTEDYYWLMHHAYCKRGKFALFPNTCQMLKIVLNFANKICITNKLVKESMVKGTLVITSNQFFKFFFYFFETLNMVFLLIYLKYINRNYSCKNIDMIFNLNLKESLASFW